MRNVHFRQLPLELDLLEQRGSRSDWLNVYIVMGDPTESIVQALQQP